MYSICSICFTNSIDSIYSINSIGSIYSRYRFKIVECQNPECKWQKRESTRQLPTPETLWPQAYAATVTLNFESKVHKYQNSQMLNCMKYKYMKYRYTNATPPPPPQDFGYKPLRPLHPSHCHLKLWVKGTMQLLSRHRYTITQIYKSTKKITKKYTIGQIQKWNSGSETLWPLAFAGSRLSPQRNNALWYSGRYIHKFSDQKA